MNNKPKKERAVAPSPRDKQDVQGRNVYSEKFAKKTIAEVAGIMSGLYDVIPQYTGNNLGWMNQQTVSPLPGSSKLIIPKANDYGAQLLWAKESRDVSLVRGPLVRRRKFVVSGFQHRHQDAKVTKLFDKIARQSKLKQSLKDIAWQLSTVGWCVVMPDSINQFPEVVHILQEGIQNKRVFGYDNLFLTIAPDIADAIRRNPQNFPKYLVDAMKDPNNHSNTVQLQDVYFLSAPRDTNQPFPRSPMYPLFEPLKVIEMLSDTQIAISSAVKKLIMHVTVDGGKDSQGNDRPANPKQLTNAAYQVRDGAQVSTIVTPSTTKIQFIAPDKEIFEAAKEPYEKAMERIAKNVNIPMILVDGAMEGVSFSTAVYIIKGFLQDVIDERETLLDDFVYPWYRKKAQELYESDKKKYAYLWNDKEQEWEIPKVIFNETELMNMTEMLQVLKFKWQMGTYSAQSIMESFQDEYETEMMRKEEFNQDTSWVGLPFEPGMGMGIDGEFVNKPPDHPDAPEDPRMAQMDLQSDQFKQTFQQQKKMDQHKINMDKIDRDAKMTQLQNHNTLLKQHNNMLQSQAGPNAQPGRGAAKPGRGRDGDKPTAGRDRPSTAKSKPAPESSRPAGRPADSKPTPTKPARSAGRPASSKPAPAKPTRSAGRPKSGESRPRPDGKNANPRAGGNSPKSV